MEPPLRHPRSVGAPASDRGATDGLWSLALALLEPEPSFGVYDEGDGLLALYAVPSSTRTLAAALGRLDLGGVLLDVTPRWGVQHATPITLDQLSRIGAPVELVHAPAAVAVPDSILAAPHDVLLKGSGRRLAFSLHDGHAVLYTREVEVLRVVLDTWIRERVARVAPDGVSPDILDTAMPSVLAPLPPDAWRRLVLEEEPRFWWLDLDAFVTDDLGDEVVVDPLRWVGGPERSWRAGWSW